MRMGTRAVRQLLKRPLTADAAVQMALLNNRGLQAAYNELGIAEAVNVRQSPAAKPDVFDIDGFRAGRDRDRTADRRQHPGAATLPARTRNRGRRVPPERNCARRWKRCGSPRKTRRAYYRAVAAPERSAFSTQADAAAATAAKLAGGFGESGAMNKLDQAREQVFYAEVTTSDRARVSSRRHRARTAGPVDGTVGQGPRVQAAERAAAAAAARARLRRSSWTAFDRASIYRSRGSSLKRWRNPMG